MNKTFTLIIIMIGVASMSGQSIEKEVIESAGITLSNGAETINFTIENHAVTTIMDGTTIWSKGFHQGSLVVIKINPVALLKPNNQEESLILDDLRVADYIPTPSPYANASAVRNSVLTTISAIA